MTKTEEKKLGFEVAEETADNIVFKRVLTGKMSAKEKKKKEMLLPKVTFHYFDQEDIDRLQAIQAELADKYVEKNDGELVIRLKAIRDFLLK
jgi:hypothetical protein